MGRSGCSGCAGLLAALILGLAVTLGVSRAEESTPSAAKPMTAKQRFKNIKVLKNLPADQLLPLMRGIDASLGVRCDFCHVRDAFDKDDKPTKGVARQMIVMVNSIKKREKALDGKATCYMCHHGHETPELQAPAPPPPPAPAR